MLLEKTVWLNSQTKLSNRFHITDISVGSYVYRVNTEDKWQQLRIAAIYTGPALFTYTSVAKNRRDYVLLYDVDSGREYERAVGTLLTQANWFVESV